MFMIKKGCNGKKHYPLGLFLIFIKQRKLKKKKRKYNFNITFGNTFLLIPKWGIKSVKIFGRVKYYFLYKTGET